MSRRGATGGSESGFGSSRPGRFTLGLAAVSALQDSAASAPSRNPSFQGRPCSRIRQNEASGTLIDGLVTIPLLERSWLRQNEASGTLIDGLVTIPLLERSWLRQNEASGTRRCLPHRDEASGTRRCLPHRDTETAAAPVAASVAS